VAKTQEQMNKQKTEEYANVARSEASKDTISKISGGAGAGASAGMSAGAAIGTAFGGPLGTVAGALIGGAVGGLYGGITAAGAEKTQRSEFDKQAREQAKQQLEQQKETAKLQRQMMTTAQQAGRARSAEGASTIKQPTMSTPAGEDISMAAMPVATRRGTQYDAWRQQTYGS
jgi:hypothetical protein